LKRFYCLKHANLIVLLNFFNIDLTWLIVQFFQENTFAKKFKIAEKFNMADFFAKKIIISWFAKQLNEMC
jgi:hypothetical protein